MSTATKTLLALVTTITGVVIFHNIGTKRRAREAKERRLVRERQRNRQEPQKIAL